LRKNSFFAASIILTITTVSAIVMNTTKFFLRHYIFPFMLIFLPFFLDRNFKYAKNIISPTKKGLKLFIYVSLLVIIFYPFLFFFYWLYFQGFFFTVPASNKIFSAVSTGLFAVMVAAIPEEFLFRGYLQEHVFKKFTGKIIGIITVKNLITSILFGAVHAVAFFDITRAATFFPSLLFGLFTEKSEGSIFYSILFHTFSNILAFVLWTFIK
jgi:membrane protease YdiL (CAAX protease family)